MTPSRGSGRVGGFRLSLCVSIAVVWGVSGFLTPFAPCPNTRCTARGSSAVCRMAQGGGASKGEETGTGDKAEPEDTPPVRPRGLRQIGQPGARQAREDFEQAERERIDKITQARVLKGLAGPAMPRTGWDMQPKRKEPADDRKVAIYEWHTPKLITFSAEGLLYDYAVPLGVILREALLRANDYGVRLPGPDFFEAHYRETHKITFDDYPCFGCGSGVSSKDWWFHVFLDTYYRTLDAYHIDRYWVEAVYEEVFDELYYEISVGPEMWENIHQSAVVLNRLADWRDNKGGPKLGVLTNSDERVHVTLENMALLPYFDFVLTSREMGYEKPAAQCFDIALQTAGLTNASEALHIGTDYDSDIAGAKEAGWEACCVNPRQSDYEEEGEPYQYHRLTRIGSIPGLMGLPGIEPYLFSRRRGQFVDDYD